MTSQTLTFIVFWASVATLVYTYVGYPLLLMTLSRWRPKKTPENCAHEIEPLVSVIIAAYNEERHLAAKLENTLALDYPLDKLEIIVTSDGSTDGTDEIVQRFASQQMESKQPSIAVRLHRQVERLGKTAAQNAAVELARGEILLFSDATTLCRPDVLRVMLHNFADLSVGCVGGRLVYVDPAASGVGSGARSYWEYETLLKRHESRIGSLIGVSGCLYAVRRSAYRTLPNEACSDFIIATVMVEQGLRAVFEPAAVCTEETNRRTRQEFKMRVRIIAQTLNDLWRHRAMLNPLRSGFYAVQLCSHKVLRYFVPVPLLMLFVASLLLSKHAPFYAFAAFLQLGFYTMAALGGLLERAGIKIRVLALPYYFVLANFAAVMAAFEFLRGERYARWETSREAAPATTTP